MRELTTRCRDTALTAVVATRARWRVVKSCSCVVCLDCSGDLKSDAKREDVDADEESSNSMSTSKESREESEGAGDRGNPNGADVKEGSDVESCLSLAGLSGASTLVMTADAGELDFAEDEGGVRAVGVGRLAV